MRRRMKAAAAVAMLAAMLMTSACGDDDDGGESAAPAGAPISDAQLREVQAVVTKHLARPTSIGITEPVKSIPKNKTVYYLYNNIPNSVATLGDAKKAASALGWTIKSQIFEPSPEGMKQAYTTAVNDPATDGIIGVGGLPTSILSEQLASAAAKDIPVVIYGGDVKSNGNLTVVGGPPSYAAPGALQADYILAQTQGRANVLVATSSVFSSLNTLTKSFKDEWAKRCPKCKAPLTYDAPAASFGTNFPALLVAYLQAHRSVDYIVFGFNDMLFGVPAALKAAGFDGLKATTWAQGPSSNALLGEGLLQTESSILLLEYPWMSFDALLRRFNGQPVPSQEELFRAESPLNWFITKEGMAKEGLDPRKFWPLVADYQEQFKRLWGVR